MLVRTDLLVRSPSDCCFDLHTAPQCNGFLKRCNLVQWFENYYFRLVLFPLWGFDAQSTLMSPPARRAFPGPHYPRGPILYSSLASNLGSLYAGCWPLAVA